MCYEIFEKSVPKSYIFIQMHLRNFNLDRPIDLIFSTLYFYIKITNPREIFMYHNIHSSKASRKF